MTNWTTSPSPHTRNGIRQNSLPPKDSRLNPKTSLIVAFSFAVLLLIFSTPSATAQEFVAPQGDVVSRDVREMYDRGLAYLVSTQTDDGTWASSGERGAGTTGLGLLALLASGEDPNFGPYRTPIRKAVQHLIKTQSDSTGYMGPSMYHHGFALLALSEAYGAVDETDLWAGSSDAVNRSIAETLELGVRCALTSQKSNPLGAWRYSPRTRDADTSVSGAVLMGLLAARNAGIEVPDENVDRAIKYFTSMTGGNGIVGYSGGLGGFGESIARSSIACLVYSIAGRKDLKQYEATKSYLINNLSESSSWPEYSRYYQAQALFQADIDAWEKWNRSLVRKLKSAQKEDGSFQGDLGPANSTSMGLLALALNYRFLPIYER
ncbi:prenyltransferase/squalene oxidase repeat-containing protein [Stieleria varia]|nr:prenyltransferase/squalene oxidase repeat-containing protein [Stieleria varia]